MKVPYFNKLIPFNHHHIFILAKILHKWNALIDSLIAKCKVNSELELEIWKSVVPSINSLVAFPIWHTSIFSFNVCNFRISIQICNKSSDFEQTKIVASPNPFRQRSNNVLGDMLKIVLQIWINRRGWMEDCWTEPRYWQSVRKEKRDSIFSWIGAEQEFPLH